MDDACRHRETHDHHHLCQGAPQKLEIVHLAQLHLRTDPCELQVVTASATWGMTYDSALAGAAVIAHEEG